jgi:uncharacterized protein (DUF1501 family)
LAKANASSLNPNETDLTRENAARVVILSDLEAEARQRLAAETEPAKSTAKVASKTTAKSAAPTVATPTVDTPTGEVISPVKPDKV